MKKPNVNSLINIFLVLMLFNLQSCEEFLREEPPSELDNVKVLSSEEGLVSLLNAIYAAAGFNGNKDMITVTEWSTDINLEQGGVEERDASVIANYTLDGNVARMNNNLWNTPYRAIRDANILLDNISIANNISDDKKNLYINEARFLRALMYYKLYMWYGPVPLRTKSIDDIEKEKATDEEMQSFIETEFLEVLPNLPDPGKEAAYGRAHKGAVRGFLTKYYLNTKQWQKCANMAQTIIDMKYYSLFPNYETMFKVENEGNKEMIWVRQCVANKVGNEYPNAALPPAFKSDPRTGFIFMTGMRNWAAHYKLYSSFYESFEPNDKRKNLIMATYVNNKGVTVDLTLVKNDIRPFKYYDQGAIDTHGNDFPFIRYADILYSRAEALNELNGPNQESIDLINAMRRRAGLLDKSLGDFLSKEDLRIHILKERGWEFWSEGVRREDLIRMDKLIEFAHARGATNAQDFHRRLPFPQAELNANSKLQQNEGY
jgi:hypothetical protein